MLNYQRVIHLNYITPHIFLWSAQLGIIPRGMDQNWMRRGTQLLVNLLNASKSSLSSCWSIFGPYHPCPCDGNHIPQYQHNLLIHSYHIQSYPTIWLALKKIAMSILLSIPTENRLRWLCLKSWSTLIYQGLSIQRLKRTPGSFKVPPKKKVY